MECKLQTTISNKSDDPADLYGEDISIGGRTAMIFVVEFSCSATILPCFKSIFYEIHNIIIIIL